MITRTATARYEGLGKEARARSPGSPACSTAGATASVPVRERARHDPEELVAAIHAGCFTMALPFALAGEGLSGGTLETVGRVTLDKGRDGFRVSRSDLLLTAQVEGIDAPRFREVAEGAKAGCPISKLLSAEIPLEIRFRG